MPLTVSPVCIFLNDSSSAWAKSKSSFEFAEMISSYSNFDNFLKELYKHEHFLDISDIEIVPYGKNRTILVIKFTLKLYAEKG